MSTIIWCDRVKHIVDESRSEVGDLIDRVTNDLEEPEKVMHPRGFAYFSISERNGIGGQQRALNVRLISSFEAAPGDPI
jgi:hypothetical protein